MKQIFTIILTCITLVGAQAQHLRWYNIVPDTEKARDICTYGDDIYISNSAGFVVLNKSTGNMQYKDVNNAQLFRSGVNEIFISDDGIRTMNNDGLLMMVDSSGYYWNPLYVFSNSREIHDNGQGVTYFVSDFGFIKLHQTGYEMYNDTNSIFELPSSSPTALSLDNNDGVWIAQYGKGLYHFDGTNFTLYDMNNSALPATDLMSVAVLDDGTVFTGSATQGLIAFDGNNFTTYNAQNSNLTWNNVVELCSANNTLYGLVTDAFQSEVFELNGGTLTMINSGNSPLPQAKFEHLAIDDDGELWFESIDNGNHSILRYDGTNLGAYVLKKSVLETPKVLDVKIANNNKASFTNNNTNYSGVNLIEAQNNVFNVENSVSNASHKIIEYNGSTVIYGGTDEVKIFSNGNFTTHTSTSASVNTLTVIKADVDDNGNLWLATDLGLVKYDGSNFTDEYSFAGSLMASHQILDMAVDNNGKFWLIGSLSGNAADGELVSFDGTNYEFHNLQHGGVMSVNFTQLSKAYDGTIYTMSIGSNILCKLLTDGVDGIINHGNTFNNSVVTCIKVTPNLRLIGTNNMGVLYHSSTGYNYLMTTSNPILSNSVTSIDVDAHNNVWIGTDKGMSVFNEDDITTLNTEEFFEQESEEEVLVYPNPFSNTFKINVKETALNSELMVYNFKGQLIEKMNINQLQHTVSLEGQESGVYFYSIVQNGVVLNSGKLIKR
ncbi:Por secretion system C-terminal sorting domain-containing protein [Lishizhenia tianjinensis]|uniref:Por secretion system C-terminal sorting domain-containing protein n=1 Tax=Lishizhenia tianjinensis TaxID=477690 RepID=A0A1I6Y3L2_9FLAO|nr:T9SS type A sorting domain-containing protein [Lishizhenia tianjinensis]SFT44963.1 Por secretion system C-terminal sorting domain-containing protein [Lishizhenia tianjinensis]